MIEEVRLNRTWAMDNNRMYLGRDLREEAIMEDFGASLSGRASSSSDPLSMPADEAAGSSGFSVSIAAAESAKRPKHVVLADTISLLKRMQVQIICSRMIEGIGKNRMEHL